MIIRKVISIRDKYSHFKLLCQKNEAPISLYSFIYSQYLLRRYAVSTEDFFNEHLWDRNINHEQFFMRLAKVKRRWSNVYKQFMPHASRLWLARHYIDYCISKLLYPGLDAQDYFMYEFYNFSREKRKTFITEGFLVKLSRHFNFQNGERKTYYTNLLSDKNKFNELFRDYVGREWLCTFNVEKEDFFKFCQGKTRVIVKPEFGGQGKGIFIAEVNTDEQINTLYDKVVSDYYLVEAILTQCEVLSRLNPSSVNTIRVYSIYKKGEVHITAASLRIGKGDAPVDNYSSGGMVAEIDTDLGMVKTRAICQDGSSYFIHPISQYSILGLQIPHWDRVLITVKNAHTLIPELRYIGWDVVVCTDNSIALLEANIYGGVELQQQAGLNGKKDIYMKYW